MTPPTKVKTLGKIAAHALALLVVLSAPSTAFAACSSPAGNAGDVAYSSVQNVLAYCNGTNWIAMGSSSTTSFGTLATNNFCTATSGTAIACTTASTGSGNVVLSAAPTLSGTVAGVSSTWTTSVAIGTSTLSGALNVNGTATATTFSGSGASLTGIGTSSLSATGTANATTYLRGDNTWATPSGGGNWGIVGTSTVTSGTTTRILYDSAGVLGEYVITGTGNVVMSASPTLTGTVTGANSTWTGTTTYQYGTNYTTTGSQQDVAINTASTVRYTGSGVATFYGIVAGVNGQILYLHNGSTSVLTLSNKSASETTVANQIVTGSGSDLSVPANSAVTLQYDNTATNSSGATGAWRLIGVSGGAGNPGGSTTQVQFNNSGAFGGDTKLTWDNTNKILAAGTGATTPVGTTGTVAGVTVNVIPQAVSVTPLGSGVTVNSATTGQMAYYSGASAISGTSNLYVSSSNIGIGTSAATYLLSLDGQSPRGIGLQRDYTAATAGQGLTINAGGAFATGSNLNGGNLVLQSGVSTGTGTSQIQFQTFPGSAGATTDNTATTAVTILGNGNVGVGSSTPGIKLDVNGTIRSTSGGVTYPDGTTQTTAASTSSMVLLNTVTASNSATLQDTTSFTASYRYYMVVLENVVPVTTTTGLYMQVYSGGAFQTTTYASSTFVFNTGSAAYGPTTYIDLCGGARVSNSASDGVSGSIQVFNPSGTSSYKVFTSQLGMYDSSASNGAMAVASGRWRGGTAAITGFKIYASSGNLSTGTVKIYGWN